MLFTRKQNLTERIVEFLAYQPNSPLQLIQEVLDTSRSRRISKQAWYKTIRELLRLEIIVKHNKTYALNIAWADHMMNLSFFIEKNYLSKESPYQIILPCVEGKKITYRFPDLISLDSFWAHLLVTIAAENPQIPFYAYNPHFWYFAAHQFEVSIYFESMKRHKVGNYTLVGARTDLDLWSEKLHPKKTSRYYCSPKPILKDSRLHILVMADYLMTAKISTKTASSIDKLFRETKISKEATKPPQEVIGFFTQKSHCTLTILKDAKKAGVFARKIRRYF